MRDVATLLNLHYHFLVHTMDSTISTMKGYFPYADVF